MVSRRSVARAAISTARTPSAISSPAPGAHHAHAQHPFVAGVEHQLGEAVGTAHGGGATGGGPREPLHAYESS